MKFTALQLIGVDDTGNLGNDPIPSIHRAGIAYNAIQYYIFEMFNYKITSNVYFFNQLNI